MKLKGSCHCGAVHFRVESHTPYPFMRCYCSICRKTQGGGGYAINIMGVAATLKARRAQHVATYRAARIAEPGAARKRLSPARRHFARRAAARYGWPTALAAMDLSVRIGDRHAAAEATGGGRADARLRAGLGRRALRPGHTHFPEYPREGIADWHENAD